MPIDPNVPIPLLSSSMRHAWRDCQRKVFYRWVAGIEPKAGKKALMIGTAFHRGLEVWRSNPMARRTPDIVLNIAEENFREAAAASDLDEEVILNSKAQVRAYVAGYLEVFGQVDTGSELVESQVFEDDGTGDGETGYVDALVRYPDGKLWVVDDKTTSSWHPEEAVGAALRLDDQLASYVGALNARGVEVAGARMRQIRKTQTRQTKAETAEDYAERIRAIYETTPSLYREFVVEFSPKEIERARRQRELDNLAVLSFLDRTNLDDWPYNPTACRGVYGPCDYLRLCTVGRDTPERTFKPRSKGPLDGGDFQRQIWNEEKSEGSGSGRGGNIPPVLSGGGRRRTR